MSLEKSLNRFLRISRQWVKCLDNYNEEDLIQRPSEHEWTLGQLYRHISLVNEMSIEQLTLCIERKGKHAPWKKKWPVKLIFFFNRLPPVKFKVPESLNRQPEQAVNKKEIIEIFKNQEERLQKLLPAIASSDPDIKTKHPRLGYLNAVDWLNFMPIHMKHHLRQKEKLEKFIQHKKS